VKSLSRIISILSLLGLPCLAFEIGLLAPTNQAADGYVLFHGTGSRTYSEIYSVGLASHYDYQGTLVDGPNYFAAAAFKVEGGILEMSTFSNELVITNHPALDLQTVVFSSTNLAGGPATWTPWATNHLRIMPTDPARFFRPGPNRLVQTNVITFPSVNPQTPPTSN